MSVLNNKRILLGVTGSIAAYKACEVIRTLRKSGASVQVIMTHSATQFIGPTTFSALTDNDVLTEMFLDPPPPGEIHLHVTESVDCMVVVPATANIIAKCAQGIADDFLSTVLLISDTPVIFVPAMHAHMWQQTSTQNNIATLKKQGKIILMPEQGSLANLTQGEGRMVMPSDVVAKIREITGVPQDFIGKRILITAGPTREHIDAVRFISNRSSGKMGIAMAQAALDRGGEVTLVTGPVSLPLPQSCDIVSVETASEMQQAVLSLGPKHDLVVMAAAVSDFVPQSPQKSKIKRQTGSWTLTLLPSQDILKELRFNTTAVLVGFALETENGEKNAVKKLREKGLDAVVLNYANKPGTGFDSDTNSGTLFIKNKKRPVSLPLELKEKMAHRILNELVKLIS